jgi:hypothetical protein
MEGCKTTIESNPFANGSNGTNGIALYGLTLVRAKISDLRLKICVW